MPTFPYPFALQFSTPTWQDIEQALWHWVQSTSGLDPQRVRWDDQQGNVPEGQFITLRIDGILNLGAVDEEQQIYDSGATVAGQEVTILENGTRSFTCTVQCYGTKGQTVGLQSPRAVLSAVKSKLFLPDVRELLAAASLSPYMPGPIRNVSVKSETIIEPRAILEVKFYCRETVQEQTGYIETINGPAPPPGGPGPTGTFNGP